MAILDYGDVLSELGKNRAYVLLGNGFSIGCDPVFSYGSLYDAAKQAGLTDKATKVFDRMGTNNFERVMRVLDEVEWIGQLYGMPQDGASAIRGDVEAIKAALVTAVAKSHLAHSGMVSKEKKESALKFLTRFQDIFTTNYDLVLYWVVMHEARPPFEDGFRTDQDEPEAPYVVYAGRSGGRSNLFYLHGALHLYEESGELRKHCWNRTKTPLTELIQAGLAAKSYPLFIAEGQADKKLEQVSAHGYLWECIQKFSRLESPLVVYGHALGPSDGHLVDAITRSKIEAVYIGLHGDPKSKANAEIVKNTEQMIPRREKIAGRGGKSLAVKYFQSETARVWG
jgi:hypothetical protein